MRDIGKLRKQRDDASDWVDYGRWATFVVAGFGLLFAVIHANRVPQEATVLRTLVYFGTGGVAFCLRPNRDGAAYALLGALALTLVFSAWLGTLLSGIALRLPVVAVAVRGALAVFRYRRLTEEIRAAETEESRNA